MIRVKGYLLSFVVGLCLVALTLAPGTEMRPAMAAQATPSDLFFSEYIEGSSFNKAIEIYNGTVSPVDLSTGGYTLELYSNGSATASQTLALSGTITAGDVLVLAHPSADPAILAVADVTNGSVINFNGDDAVVLRKNGAVVDAFGQVGFDPGSEWAGGGIGTADETLRRQADICGGDANETDPFDPSIEWDGFPNNTFDGLGSHTANCNGGPADTAPQVISSTPTGGANNVAVDAPVSVTFNEAVSLSGTFDITCAPSGNNQTGITPSTGDNLAFSFAHADFTQGDACSLTIPATSVTDNDGDDPPDNMEADFVLSFNIIAPAPASNLIITEIMYDPNSAEDNWEWVEIYNAGGSTIDLSGYVLDDNNSTAHAGANIAGGSLASGQAAILYNSDDVSAADFQAAWGTVNLVAVTNWAALALNNTGDQVSLWSSFASYSGDNVAHNNAIDTVNFSSSSGFPDPVGASIYLTDLNADNNVGANWAASVNGVATPIFTAYTSLPAGGNSGADVGSPGTPVAPGQPFPLAEGFDTNDCTTLTGWQVVSVDPDTANTWLCSQQFSNAEANGFGDSAAANEWLITPALNMDAQTDERLTFRNQTSFTDSGVAYPQLEVVYSTNYSGSGDPTSAAWTPLTGIIFSPENSGSWVDSSEIDLSGITGSSVYFAFHYTSSGTGSGTAVRWRIDTVNFFVKDTSAPVAARIHEIQGSGPSVTNLPAPNVIVEAVVVGDYQASDQLSGFFIQEEDADVDGDANTSEGIFVFCGGCATNVAVGDIVQVTGLQEEFFGMSQIDVTGGGSITVMSSGNALPTAASVGLPAGGSTEAEATFENVEGMLVTFTNTLFVSEYFELARYGHLVLTADARPRQFTDANEPSVAGYAAFLANLNSKRIFLDDDNNIQNDALGGTNGNNPALDEPFYWPRLGLSNSNLLRGGDSISNLTGVLHWSFAGQSGTDAWRIRPVEEAFSYNFTSNNPRPATPNMVGGTLKVASLNVLNYFTTINSRGADSTAELDRQRAKTAAAICVMAADIVGLIEIENNAGVALNDLLNGIGGINANCGPYQGIATGVIGTDAIAVTFIYKPATVNPVGSHAILTSSVDPRFDDTKNRPTLAQTFEEMATGERLTVAVNHLKSKGSACDDVGDPDIGDGAGNCNLTRKAAAQAMVDWLATDPTGSGDPDFLIIGDLNSYRNEDPIDALEAGADDMPGTADDFTDLIDSFSGAGAYSFVFDGQLGYLDYALANQNLKLQITGVTEWAINADEIPVFDYNDDVEDVGNESFFERESTSLPIYEANAFRSSDHDPVVVGLALSSTPQCNGVDATIYVNEAGKIVGGPADGKSYDDILPGTLHDDVIVGTDENDLIIGFAGDDLICGLGGRDILNGLLGKDTLDGGDDKDVLNGGPGDDNLSGGGESDLLNGGLGADTCDGGEGKDIGLSCETKTNIP